MPLTPKSQPNIDATGKFKLSIVDEKDDENYTQKAPQKKPILHCEARTNE